jgi:hypothetical protein
MSGSLFKTKGGFTFAGMAPSTLSAVRAELVKTVGVLPGQICEAASYSMAMVVRYALGLTAAGGKVCAIVNDTLSGWIALATLRHLAIAGTEPNIVFVIDPAFPGSQDLNLQLQPFEHLGVNTWVWSAEARPAIERMLGQCHNALCGLFDIEGKMEAPDELVGVMNELRTPIHAVEAPVGISAEDGKPGKCPLFASSTLSLGAPLAGLWAASDYVGRHYVCDISILPAMYKKAGADLSSLFAEQPVVQIFPEKPEEKE